MKTAWDYSKLADAYLKRPDYSQEAIDELVIKTGLQPGAKVCDVGAGVAHLTLMLAEKGFEVTAVEPNDAMRENGKIRTKSLSNVTWHEGTGEKTGQEFKSFDLVTFGSSFNVCNREEALKETVNILKAKGWFFCLWNHRDLSDPIQLEIESIIKSFVSDYGYGSRREDQTEIIESSGFFDKVSYIQGLVKHSQSIDECVEAWRSHATLQRQAGDKFDLIITEIQNFLNKSSASIILIPYTTRAWIAQLK